MTRLRQRTLTFAVVLCLFTLVLVPMGYGSTVAQNGVGLSTVAETGPTLPPLPWCGLTGPTLPPLPWDGLTGPTLPPLPWDGLTGPTLPPLPWDGIA